MEMDCPKYRRQRHAVIAFPVRSIMGVSRSNHTDGRMAEVYGRPYSAETASHTEETQYIIQLSFSNILSHAYIIYFNADHSSDGRNALCRRIHSGYGHHPQEQADHTENK